MQVDPKGKSVRTPRVTFFYCLEWPSQFLVQAFSQFCDSVELVTKVWNFLGMSNINKEIFLKLTK